MIDIRSVGKAYGNYTALNGIDMEIRQGEFFSLVGPSGCGKTTLLKIIGGFEQATAGRLLIGGEDMGGTPAYRRPTNMVFQSYALFPHMNIRKNVGYGMRKSRLPAAEKARIVDDALALVKMSDFADRLPGQLSGGQKQRIALARAIVCKPKVLLLDEPLGALDKRLREEMQFELKSLQRRLGITFVCVTHDQEEAMSMSDRIAVMSAGRLLQIDTPDNLYERPVSRGVADFVGSMNFFDVKLRERHDNGSRLTLAGGIVVETVNRGEGTVLALRPEWLRLSAEPPAPSVNTMTCTLTERSYLGGRNVYLVQTGASDRPVSVMAQQTHSPTALLQPGERLWLSWAPEAGVLLPS
ncbi:ABC transporter ATP-binding protein (plasmid) [Sinorhizobium sp. BG8]|nr:ABC transporter ATP-binding protein [Sinorhizobium sp. BG8]